MTAAYQPLTITEINRDRWDDQDSIEEGQGLCMAAVGLTNAQFDGLPDSHPGVRAWEVLVDEVIEEVNAKVGDLLCEALERRLPWTWEPER